MFTTAIVGDVSRKGGAEYCVAHSLYITYICLNKLPSYISLGGHFCARSVMLNVYLNKGTYGSSKISHRSNF